MSLVAGRSTALGVGLVGLGFLGVIASYPPPVVGGGLVDRFGLFAPLAVSVVALLLATAGGVVISLQTTRGRDRAVTFAVSPLGPVVAVGMVGSYLATVAGFDPGVAVIVVGLMAAGVIGLVGSQLA